VDFGIAAQVHPITRMARAQGTFYFMAPEMFGGYATPASDVYMLGFIIYWLYAGLPPYPVPTLPEGASTQDWADAIQHSRTTPAPPLGRFRLDIPAEVTELVAKALSPDPNHRFPNAMMFWAALRGV
jgi:serine/threonine-protein kinase